MSQQDDIQRARDAGLVLPEKTYPWTVDTIGKHILDGYSIRVYCDTYGCHHSGDIDLVAFALKHGVNHGALAKDLKPHFFCQKCKVAGRPHKNISFRLSPDSTPKAVNPYVKAKGV